MREKVELYNDGVKSILIFRTKEGHPIILHPKKTIKIEKEQARKLQEKYKYLIIEKGNDRKEVKAKKSDKIKEGN